jgi:hypothetical protein
MLYNCMHVGHLLRLLCFLFFFVSHVVGSNHLSACSWLPALLALCKEKKEAAT